MAFLWILILIHVTGVLFAAAPPLGVAFAAVWAAATLYCTLRNIPYSPGVFAVAAEGEVRPDPGLPLLHDARWTY